jgi:hypothetical protein
MNAARAPSNWLIKPLACLIETLRMQPYAPGVRVEAQTDLGVHHQTLATETTRCGHGHNPPSSCTEFRVGIGEERYWGQPWPTPGAKYLVLGVHPDLKSLPHRQMELLRATHCESEKIFGLSG